jgi:hypothetical protein
MYATMNLALEDFTMTTNNYAQPDGGNISGQLRWFALADLISLLAFVIIGKVSHNQALTISEISETAWPFLLGMAIAGWWLRTPLPTSGLAFWPLVNSTLAGWLLAVPFGLVLRELVHGKPILTSFAITTFIFGALLLLAGRLTVWLITRKTLRQN